MFGFLHKTARRKAKAGAHYAQVVARAREPVFFREFGVPDTLDGRFDLVALHAWLALERFKGQEEAQGLTDALFIGFDEAMREQGAGDIGMGKKMQKFADAFYGRMKVYADAQTVEDLGMAIARNLYRGASPKDARARALAEYAWAARDHLKYGDPDTLNFGPLPAYGAV